MIFISKSIRLPLSKTHPKSSQFWPSPLPTVQDTIYCLNLRVAFPPSLLCVNSFPLQFILHIPASCDFSQVFWYLAKALWMLLMAVRTKAFSFCQGLQALHDLDPTSSFPIIFQPHWLTFHPSKPTIFSPPHSLWAYPSFYSASRHYCFFAIIHGSDKMSFFTAQATLSPPKQSLSV